MHYLQWDCVNGPIVIEDRIKVTGCGRTIHYRWLANYSRDS